MFENPFRKSKDPRENLQEETEKKYLDRGKKELGMTRRNFLKGALATSAILAGGGAVKKAIEMSKKEAKEASPSINSGQEENISEEKIEINPEEAELTETELEEIKFGEIEIEDEDREMMENIFQPDINKKFEVNLDVTGAITKYWIHKYQTVEKRGLLKAKKEMDKISILLGEQFKKNGVPEEMMYLAIPESGWKKSKSKKGARGYYQFMPKTAKMYGLKNPNDPIESGGACARLLKDLYDKSGDWDLALAGYNGGFFWKYIIKCKKNNADPNYSDFLKMIENKVNSERKEILEAKGFTHTIEKRKGNSIVESLWYLSKKFNVSIEEIEKANSEGASLSKKIFEGKKIKIPYNKEYKQIEYREKVSGLIENIQYPPKFNAVLEALEISLAKYVSREKTSQEMT